MMYDGDRCSIVTCAASSAIAGTMVTAVAPLPMIDDAPVAVVEVLGPLLGMDDRPGEASMPGSSGVYPLS